MRSQSWPNDQPRISIAYEYTYEIKHLCAGVIFDAKQDGDKIFSEFEFLFFGNKIWDLLKVDARSVFVDLSRWLPNILN